MKIIVLSLNVVKEKDVLINAISSEAYLTFKAHGVLSPTNKNASINNVLAMGDAIITQNKTGTKSLKECSVNYIPDFTSNNLTYLTVINLLYEATNKMLEDEEKYLAFPYLEKALLMLKDAKHPLFIAIAYLAKLIKLSGSSFEINRCVICGKKQNIVGFSFIDGGYICKDCMDENMDLTLTRYQLSIIRLLCGTTDFDFSNLEYKEEEVLFLLRKFIVFISDAIGIDLESAKLLIKY